VATVSFVSVIAPGSGSAASSSTTLRTIALGVVPSGDKVLGEYRDACDGGPCVGIVFSGVPRSYATRRSAAIAHLRKLGWRLKDRPDVAGDVIRVARGRLYGYVAIFKRPAASCGHLNGWQCLQDRVVDDLQITRTSG
jgi:hypothetical protein